MATIRLATAAVVRSFQTLTAALSETTSNLTQLVDSSALEDEIGRFRVWSGNLGALQKGHSSADYRLRDSPLLAGNTLKLLKELSENISESVAVILGLRLPYEQQAKSAASDAEDDDGFYSDDSDSDSDSGAPKTELGQRFREIVDIIDNLYHLAVRIRQPTLKTRSLKAASYRPKDPETGVDILEQYAAFDLQHTRELIAHLRAEHAPATSLENDVLVERLSRAVTLRRRQFKYWRRHRDKLGNASLDDRTQDFDPPMSRPVDIERHDTLEVNQNVPVMTLPKETPSQKTGRTLLSGTEATQHHQSLDDIVDTKSVTSYATTVRDLSGKGIELPSPPKTADGERDFECPYCFIICPARYGKGRAWRTHLLQDLQPYLCTYPHCESGERLFRSRREWSEHEASHRKAWRCPEHPSAVYQSRRGLEDHLRRDHSDSFPEQQLDSIVRVGETSTIDMRENCPICFTAAADVEGLGGLQNHIAHHLERLASFSLPTTAGNDDSDAGSSVASRGASATSNSSQELSEDLSEISIHSTPSRNSDQSIAETLVPSLFAEGAPGPSTQNALSAESLGNIPDYSKKRLDFLLPDTAKDGPIISEVEEPRGAGTPSAKDSLQPAERLLLQSILSSVCKAVKGYTDQQLIALFSEPARRKCCDFFTELPWSYRSPEYEQVIRNPVCMSYIKAKVDGNEYSTLEQFRRDVLVMCSNCRTFNRPGDSASAHANRIEELCTTLIRNATEDPTNHPEIQALDLSEDDSASSTSLQRNGKEPLLDERDPAATLISLFEIPTISDMYKSQGLLEKSHEKPSNPPNAPNASWNKTVSVISHDITRLRVDCIVNSANRDMKYTRLPTTLNRYIHRAAGPQLRKDCRKFGRVEPGDVRLTKGYALPANFVIHASRPLFQSSSGSEALAQCYWNALNTAKEHGLMSIAFPCLGAGGCGFPAHTAAKIALREVRRFLDNNPDYSFTRIIFCVYNNTDLEYYKDLVPIYFPPCQDERHNSASYALSDYNSVIRSLQDARIEAERIWDLLREFAHKHDLSEVMQLPYYSKTLSKISNTLRDLHFLFYDDKKPAPKVSSQLLSDFELLSTSLKLTTGGLTEMTSRTMQFRGSSQPESSSSAKRSWDDYNQFMFFRYEMDVQTLLATLANFTLKLGMQLNEHMYNPDEGPDNMALQRDKLSKFRRKQTGDSEKRSLEFFDEVLYMRDFQQESAITDAPSDLIPVHKISSLAQLYQLGELEFTPTDVTPTSRGLTTVCFVRADITRLSVDVLVNSTSRAFGATGSLDKLVFRKGGKSMVDDCKDFGICKDGDVKLTSGYNLPAKHVVHVIPMEVYGDRAKNILRTLYKKALQEASKLKATSIAFPAIGTGALCYPLDHATSVAVQEVRKFLDTAPTTNTIKKIVFCVYGSVEEKTYKSLLPVFFPPLEANSTTKPPAETPGHLMVDSKDYSTMPEATSPRTLIDPLGETVRNVTGAGNQSESEPMRSISEEEKRTLDQFDSHAKKCPTCIDIFKLYSDNKDLCPDGYAAAQKILRHLYMNPSGHVFSTDLQDGKRVKVQIPADNVHCWKLLVIVEKSFRDAHRTRPFVSANQPYSTIFEEVDEEVPAEDPIDKVEVTFPPEAPLSLDDETKTMLKRALEDATTAVNLEYINDTLGAMSAYESAVQLLDTVASRCGTRHEADKLKEIRIKYAARIQDIRDKPVFAGIFTRVGDALKPFAKGEFTIDVYPGKVQIYDDALNLDKPTIILELDLNPGTALVKSKDADIAIKTRVNFQSPSHEPVGKDDIVFRCQDKVDCDRLFKRLKEARRTHIEPKAETPVEALSEQKEKLYPFYNIAAFSASPDWGATPQAGKWYTTGYILQVRPGKLEVLRDPTRPQIDDGEPPVAHLQDDGSRLNQDSPQGKDDSKLGEENNKFSPRKLRKHRMSGYKSKDDGQRVDQAPLVMLDLTPETYAEVSTVADAQGQRGIFIGRRYMPFHLLLIKCYDDSQTGSIVDAITKSTQRAKSVKPVERKDEENMESMISEMEEAGKEELEREKAFVEKRAKENALKRARAAEEARKEDERLRQAERAAEELEGKQEAQRLGRAKSVAEEVTEKRSKEPAPDSLSTSPPPPQRKTSGFLSLFSQQSKEQTTSETTARSSGLPQRSVTREFLTRADQLLETLKKSYPAGTTYKSAASELGIEEAKAVELAKYLAELGLVDTLGGGWIKPLTRSSNPKGQNEDLELEAPEADPKPRRLSKVAQRLLFLLGPLQPSTRLGFNFVIARENELRTVDVDRAMQELKDLGITYQSRSDTELWYTSEDVDAGLRLVQLPEGVPAMSNEEEKYLAKQFLKFREHGTFTKKDIAHALGIEGKQGVDLSNILEHLQSLGLVARFYYGNGQDLWTVVRDPGEQPRPRAHAAQAGKRTVGPIIIQDESPSLAGSSAMASSYAARRTLPVDASSVKLDDMFSYSERDVAEKSDRLYVPLTWRRSRSRERSSSLDTFDRKKRSEEPDPEHIRTRKISVAIQQDETPSSTSLSKRGEIVAGKVHFEDDEVTHPRPVSPDHDQPKPIPPGARWTKINRRLVSPQALQEARERFEERMDHIVVLRVLTRDEIQKLADRTAEIRSAREDVLQLHTMEAEPGEEREKPRSLQGKEKPTDEWYERESSGDEARRRSWRRSRDTTREFGKKARDSDFERGL